MTRETLCTRISDWCIGERGGYVLLMISRAFDGYSWADGMSDCRVVTNDHTSHDDVLQNWASGSRRRSVWN